MERKGQGMSDFLITYGWAILVVLIVVGTLAGLSQLGVIKTDSAVPETCEMRLGLACVSHKVEPEFASLRFVNGIGKDITIVNISIGTNCSESFNKNFDRGETITFELFGCQNGERLTRFDGDILIHYKDKGLSRMKSTGGTLISRIR